MLERDFLERGFDARNIVSRNGLDRFVEFLVRDGFGFGFMQIAIV